MSQTTGHTTGPWYYSSGAVWADKGERRGVAMRVSLSPIPPVERDANMRLIAQAPAMLAVLARSVRIITGQPTSTEALDEANVEHFLTEARAILRATEGA